MERFINQKFLEILRKMAESKEEIKAYRDLIAKHKGLSERLYTPIESNREFNRDEFVSSFDDYKNLQAYVKALREDSNDPYVTRGLAELLTKNQEYFEQFDDPSVKARVYGNSANEESKESMAEYVQGNLDDFFKLYDDTDMLALVSSVPLYKLNEDKSSKEHNEFVDLFNEIRSLEEISKDPRKIRVYVDDKIEDTPEWFKEVYGFFSGRQDHMQALFQEFSKDTQIDFLRASRTEDGSINMKKLEGILRNGTDEALKEYRSETNEGDKKDIWNTNIRPIYLTVAELIYGKEKAKIEEHKNPERVERKERRREKGMRA